MSFFRRKQSTPTPVEGVDLAQSIYEKQLALKQEAKDVADTLHTEIQGDAAYVESRRKAIEIEAKRIDSLNKNRIEHVQRLTAL